MSSAVATSSAPVGRCAVRRQRHRLRERLALDHAGHQTRERHRVTADVQNAAAAERRIEQPALRIARNAKREVGPHVTDRPDHPVLQARDQRLAHQRVAAVHERLHQEHTLCAPLRSRVRRARPSIVSGFSHRTCLPASMRPAPAPRATDAASRCRRRRRRDRPAASPDRGAARRQREAARERPRLGGRRADDVDDPAAIGARQRLREVRRDAARADDTPLQVRLRFRHWRYSVVNLWIIVCL